MIDNFIRMVLIMKKILVLALTFLVCLAACGTQNNESKQNVSDKETTIYTDAKNDKVEIPKNPKRIAMLNFHYVGNFIKLDKKPILINEFAKESDVIKNATQGIETVGNDDVEKVASAKPDLIITYSSDPNFKKYTKIAPTLALDVGGDMDFKEALKIQAKMVGKEDKANHIIQEWDKQIAKDKADLGDKIKDKTATILEAQPKYNVISGRNMSRGSEVLYDAYGLTVPKKTQSIIDAQKENRQVRIGNERIPEIDADYLVLLPENAGRSVDDIFSQSVWRNLTAYQNGHVLEINDASFSDWLSIEAVRQQMKSQLMHMS